MSKIIRGINMIKKIIFARFIDIFISFFAGYLSFLKIKIIQEIFNIFEISAIIYIFIVISVLFLGLKRTIGENLVKIQLISIKEKMPKLRFFVMYHILIMGALFFFPLHLNSINDIFQFISILLPIIPYQFGGDKKYYSLFNLATKTTYIKVASIESLV
jgi:hypothetical protein